MKEKIKISGKTKKDGEPIYWVSTIKPPKEMVFVDDGRIMYVPRNYYLSDGKVRYNRTGEKYCSNASYNRLYSVYALLNGVYAYMIVTSDDQIDKVLQDVKNHVSMISQENIDSWKEALVEF